MEFTKEELTIMKNHLSESLESIYKSIGTPNAKELAFASPEKFNGNHGYVDVENTQSALKKIIEAIMDETTI